MPLYFTPNGTLVNSEVGASIYFADTTLVQTISTAVNADVTGALSTTITVSSLLGSATQTKLVKPTSDISAGTWSSNAGTLYNAVDEEVAQDSDYIYTNTAGVAVLGLEAFDDAGTDNGFSIEYRAASDNGARTLRVALKQGAAIIAQETRANIPTTETSYIFSIPAASAANITNFSGLSLELEFS